MLLVSRALTAAVATAVAATSLAVTATATGASPAEFPAASQGQDALPWRALDDHGDSGHDHGDDYVVNPDVPPLKRADDAPIVPADTVDGTTDGAPSRKEATAQYADRLPRAVSTYDVHVVGANTPLGAHGTTRESARKMIARLDAEYNRETRGRYRFRMASYRTITSDEAACDLDWWGMRTGISTPPSAGATDSTWVVVGAAPCDYAGIAYINGAGMHVLPEHFVPGTAVTDPGSRTGEDLDVLVLAHEMGHNLGLGHARAQSAHTDSDFPGQYYLEYGSHFSSMGALRSTFRLGAAELVDLGVTPASDMAFATATSTTVTLGSLGAASGTRTLVVPLRDTHHAVVSFRDGTGHDWPLKYGVPNNPDNSPATDIGVHVESEPFLVSLRSFVADRDANFLTTASPAGRTTEDEKQRQAFVPGETVVLSGGITVKVVSATPTSATVTVTRPTDKQAPVLNPYDSVNACDNISSVTARRPGKLKRSGTTCSTLGTSAKLAFNFGRTVDDTWVARTGVDVNGTTVATRSWTMARRRSGQGAQDFQGGRFTRNVTLAQGTSKVTVWVEDIFGKRTSRTSTVTLKKDLRTSAVRSLKAKKVKRTSVKLTWKRPATRADTVTDYVVKVSRMKNGSWTAPKTYQDRTSPRTGTTVKGLRPGVRYRFQVVAKNKHGLSAVRAAKVRTQR